ncbi:hypothetical protein AB6A23_20040 [Paenibacillus tarimensis]
MAKKIGIFANEEQIIRAVRTLENEGFHKNELKVLAKNAEHSRRVESESDVHADELDDLAETRENREHPFFIPYVALGAAITGGGLNTGATAGPSNNVAGGALFGGLLANDAFTGDNDGVGSAITALGLDEREAALCRSAIHSGSLVIVADTGESADQSGSGISRLDQAEAVFRSCGAVSVH